MKKNKPLISIIVPVYNVEKYLARCLDTLLNQTYIELEIILVNDGSTDNSGIICDKYSNDDKRIKVYHQSNKGLSGARNTGLKFAEGEFIGFVDSDDWVEPNMFEVMVETLLTKNVGVVECGLNKLYKKSSDKSPSVTRNIYIENRLEALKRIIKNQSFSVWRRLYKANLIKNIFFVEGKNSEDVYYTLNVFQKIDKIAFIDDKLYNYFIGGVSITRGGYRLKTLDTVDAALFLHKTVEQQENDSALKSISNDFLLEILIYNYKSLSKNKQHDPSKEYRHTLKKLIVKHSKKKNVNPQIYLAKNLPIFAFELLIRLKDYCEKSN